VFCLFVVLVELSVLAKWLARKTPLRKPNRGEGIISIKPRPKSAHDFLGLLHCFIVLLSICVVSCPYVIYYPTVMARYSLFVLKVPLNPKQTNNQTVDMFYSLDCLCDCIDFTGKKYRMVRRKFCSWDSTKNSTDLNKLSASLVERFSGWWRFTVAVTRWSQSTQLLYIEPG